MGKDPVRWRGPENTKLEPSTFPKEIEKVKIINRKSRIELERVRNGD